MYDEQDKEFLDTESFDANWFDKLDDEKAAKILSEGSKIKEFDNTGSSWWTLYKFNNVFYVGLCDYSDIWEVEEEDLIEKCII